MCAQELCSEDGYQPAYVRGGKSPRPATVPKSLSSPDTLGTDGGLARRVRKVYRRSKSAPNADDLQEDTSSEQDSYPSNDDLAEPRPWRVPMLLTCDTATIPEVVAPETIVAPTSTGAAQDRRHPCFFLNVWLQRLPVKEVVKDQAFKELSSLPSPLRGFAAECATKIVTKSMAVKKMGEEFPVEMQSSLEEAGITTEVTEVFRKGDYLVLRVSVLQCNVAKLVSTRVSKDTARKVNWIADRGGTIASRLGVKDRLKARSDRIVCPKVAAQLCDVLPEELPTKMAAKKPGLMVNIVAKSEAAQAQYFFDALQTK